MHLRSVRAQLTNRWRAPSRRSTTTTSGSGLGLTLACVAREVGEVDRLLDLAERWLLTQDFELI